MSLIKNLLRISIITLGMIAAPFASAQSIPNPISEIFKDVPTIISTVSKFVVPVAALGLLGLLIYGGFTRLSSAGDPEKEKQAMQIIKSAVIGFIIIISASMVVGTIGAILGIPIIGLS